MTADCRRSWYFGYISWVTRPTPWTPGSKLTALSSCLSCNLSPSWLTFVFSLALGLGVWQLERGCTEMLHMLNDFLHVLMQGDVCLCVMWECVPVPLFYIYVYAVDASVQGRRYLNTSGGKKNLKKLTYYSQINKYCYCLITFSLHHCSAACCASEL